MDDAYLSDSGVFVRWYVPQVGWEHAQQVRDDFLDSGLRLETVDLARIEVAAVLRKVGLLTGKMTKSEVVAASRAIDDLGVKVHATDADAIELATDLACARGISVYDAVFASRALTLNLTLLSSDARLCRALAGIVPTELLRGIG